MASVTFLSSVGGDNSVVTDDNNPTTGLGNDGHRVRLVPALAQVVAVAGHVVNTASSFNTDINSVATNAAIAVQARNQAQTARDQAVAGLGAADQSLNLVQLAYGIARALAQAAQALRNHDRVLTYHTQSGTATVTQSASSAHFRNYASVAVTLPKPFLTTDYQVVVETEAAAPFLGAEGQIIVSARATNGFVLLITGSATSATLRWKVIHPNAK
jgi:hypothetical protein